VSGSLAGAILGVIAAVGALLALSRVPQRRRTFAARVEPYLGRPAAAGPRGGSVAATSPTELVADLAARGAAWLDRLVGGDASVRCRLDQLGGGTSEEFRISQLTWGGIALAAVLGLGVLRTAVGAAPPPLLLLTLALAAGGGGALARDRALSRAVAGRQSAIVAQFPPVADLIALSVTAGEGPLGSLQRVATICRGELAEEFRRTISDTRSGAPLVPALEALADRTGVPVLRRFVDGLVVAVERGTPLAEVLRAQAADVREASRHALIETAARKEVVMMIPVVFLVLPTAVVFAMFPGFYGLSLSTP